MAIFSKAGLEGGFLIAHVIVAMMWMGLLWFFNFVQTPAYAEMDAAARNQAFDKVTWRALWWFRWAAVATVVTGLLILGFQDHFSDSGYFKSAPGMAIATGILFGLTMFVNVWGVIWRNQKLVIANARNVQAGGEADPAAAPAGRKALLASRQNTIFSLPMLVFMIGASHFPYKAGSIDLTGGKRGLYWAITAVVWIVFELNALGKIGGTAPGGTNVIYDTHKNAIIAGACYAVFVLLVFSLVLAA